MLSISSLARLEVKWANVHRGNDGFYEKWHANPYYELIVVTDGPIYLQVEEERLTVHAGECLFLLPWQRHCGWKPIDEHSGFFWVQFAIDPEPLLSHSKDGTIAKTAPPLPEFSSGELRTTAANGVPLWLAARMETSRRFEISLLLEQLVAELRRPQAYYQLRLAIKLWTVLELLASGLLQQHYVDPALPGSFVLYRRIVNILDEYYDKELTASQLEELMDRKYEYLCSIFKRYAGLTMTTYVQQLRIQRACRLLSASSRTISEIAAEAGFQDPSYFGRLFKRHVGVTPQAYRNRHRPDPPQL
ncbi:AraC family transcriptional regulator [Paenibacillus sp. 598K]|uniref:AraC family transcriptional regulator n=1 Tax=Paenibacillus sp. 598K TaxID=1117987 RepID=UPI000FFB043B|nr:AraC family transcriptional regulator [Paenibacillus sp. 598K]GBF71893.1 AraC family transcriptional regulator [Paenibacillus sp. 598K]